MNIAIYGGSFNPPHLGHAMVAAAALWSGRAEQVWLVPAWSHAFAKTLAPFDQRIEACQALAETVDADRVRVCPVERDLPTPSYTIQTLEHLAAMHPEARFSLLVGADTLVDTPQWKDWDRIEAGFSPIVIGRSGHPTPPNSIVVPNISSTEVRRRMAAGETVRHLVPARVLPLLTGWGETR